MDSQIVIDNPEGMGHQRGNEWCSDSKIPAGDAGGLRTGSKPGPKSGGGGLIAIDILEGADYDEPHKASRKCIALYTAARDPEGRTEVVFHALKQNGESTDPHMFKYMRVVTGNTPAETTLEFLVPVKGLAASGVTDTMWAPDGMSFTQQQSDGNFVTYQASAPFSKANARAVWSAWTGKL